MITIEKHWDGNEAVREVRGRLYVSAGRWQWIVLVDGEVDSEHGLKRQASARATKLQHIAKLNGKESA